MHSCYFLLLKDAEGRILMHQRNEKEIYPSMYGLGTEFTEAPRLRPETQPPIILYTKAHAISLEIKKRKKHEDTMHRQRLLLANNWFHRISNFERLVTTGWTPRYLGAYTLVLSSFCYGSALSLFLRRGSSLDAFRIYPLARSCSACLVRQPIHQRRRTIVPLVLNEPSSQTINIPSRYHTNCLAHILPHVSMGMDYTIILVLDQGGRRISIAVQQHSRLSPQSLQGYKITLNWIRNCTWSFDLKICNPITLTFPRYYPFRPVFKRRRAPPIWANLLPVYFEVPKIAFRDATIDVLNLGVQGLLMKLVS